MWWSLNVSRKNNAAILATASIAAYSFAASAKYNNRHDSYKYHQHDNDKQHCHRWTPPPSSSSRDTIYTGICRQQQASQLSNRSCNQVTWVEITIYSKMQKKERKVLSSHTFRCQHFGELFLSTPCKQTDRQRKNSKKKSFYLTNRVISNNISVMTLLGKFLVCMSLHHLAIFWRSRKRCVRKQTRNRKKNGKNTQFTESKEKN